MARHIWVIERKGTKGAWNWWYIKNSKKEANKRLRLCRMCATSKSERFQIVRYIPEGE